MTRNRGGRAVLAFGAGDGAEDADPRMQQWRAREQLELLSEELRLFYVALTRARHRCYLAWARTSQVPWSALAWLLHEPARAQPGPALCAEPHLKKLDKVQFVRGPGALRGTRR